MAVCIQCNLAYCKQYRAENENLIKHKAAERRQREHDILLAKHRKYNEEHRQEIRAKNFIRNRIARAAGLHKKYKHNRDAGRISAHRYRARKKSAIGTHTLSDIKRQYDLQKGRCYYCHKRLKDKYHIDHVIPLDRGGSDSPENLVVSCPTCNLRKSNKLPHEWPEGGRLL